ncbi:MAG: FtsH protease activity modulator HflK [Deltaproteobacteria bacterium]|nr:FtsH protease activity modulator HflK [Deltaproteobacteria bacterium]
MPWDPNKPGGGSWGEGPPPIEDVVKKLEESLRSFKSFRKKLPGAWVLLLLFFLLWMASGVYVVAPEEMGVVKRFGAMVRTSPPGPHWHVPFPVETVLKPKVTKVHRLEVGFRTITAGPPARYRSVPSEALMLTGDENIVALEFIVQYRIKDPVQYLFAIKGQEKTIKDASEAAMREVVGKNRIDDVLTGGKLQIQEDTKSLLQEILDKYHAGLKVDAVRLQDVLPPKPVIEAFKDVASAKEDKEKTENQAMGYRNDILPKAKGMAEQLVNEAQAYREAEIDRAKGDVSRFLQVLTEYRKAKDVTRTRIYLETMEKIMPRMEKIIIDGKTADKILPYLPLDRIQKGTQDSAAVDGKGGRR